MLREPRRLLSAALAIVLGVAFVAATLLLGSSLSATMNDAAARELGSSAAVVTRPNSTAPSNALTNALADRLRGVSGATDVRRVGATFTRVQAGEQSAMVGVGTAPALSARTTLVDGRLPAGPNEAVVTPAFRDRNHAPLGTTFTLPDSQDEAANPITVVGVLSPGSDTSAQADQPFVFIDTARYFGLAGSFDTLLIDGPRTAAFVDEVRATLRSDGNDATVRSYADELAERRKALTGGVDVLRNMLLAFAAIAVFVAMLVIANTFSITLAQRRRSLALLRCVGATRRQVFGQVLTEALLLGAIASALGVGAGVALAALLVRLSDRVPGMAIDRLAVTPSGLLVPAGVGVVITVLSAIAPARGATRVAPLAALRPELPADSLGRAGWARIGIGAVLFAAGLAALGYGALHPSLPWGIAGGVGSFAGFLVLGPVVIPAAVRLLGWPLRRTGVPGDLAVGNARRNPRRSAATASALLVGVTLITMMSVGAASAQATEERAMARQFPTDAAVVSDEGALPADVLDAVRRTDGVAQAVPGHYAQATITAGGRAHEPLGVFVIDPADGSIFRQPSAVRGLADDAILLDGSTGIRDGDHVTVTIGSTTRELRAVVDRDHLRQGVMTETTLRRFGADAPATVLVRFDEQASAWAVVDSLQSRLRDQPVRVQGISMGKAELQKVVNILLYIVTGLLAMSVLIALVGVANTLGLSILERTQESGLLRALGLTRRQLSSMIGLEAVLIAFTAVVLGLGLGTLFGVAGIYALVKGSMTIVVAIPWARLALVAVIAVGAGWVASVAPSLRAARVSPSAALATE